MEIHGFNKTTLLDYLEHVAATVFTGGCNFRCPFCHNASLVLHPGECPVISEDEVLAYLKKRKGIPEGICITGGEPTLQKDLRAFISKVRDIPYEFRTTVVKGIHTVEEFEKIGRLLSGCRAYYLQSYRDNENVISEGYTDYPAQIMRDMEEKARKYIDKVELRGVE